jgi:hypothetical protein
MINFVLLSDVLTNGAPWDKNQIITGGIKASSIITNASIPKVYTPGFITSIYL